MTDKKFDFVHQSSLCRFNVNKKQGYQDNNDSYGSILHFLKIPLGGVHTHHDGGS
ncbi:MAG: hypothetical protein PSX36_04070 [bacterium]|nr:hypothetical protein [bacterium]